MSQIHAAIEERWQDTADLLELVPLARSCVGNFPSYDAKAAERVYPLVSREIQGEQTEHWTSDGRIFRTTMLFRIRSINHEDGQAVREALWGTPGVDGFEGQSWATATLRVMKSREQDFGEFQEDDGLWTFLLTYEFVWLLEASVPIDPDDTEGETLLYSQTTDATIDNEGAESPLISTGVGDVEIAANSQRAGDKFIVEASGYYNTKASGAGSLVVKFKWGTELTLTFDPINFLGAQTAARWSFRGTVTRRSIGAGGVVRASGMLFAENVDDQPLMAGTAGDVTLPTTAAKSFAVTGDFSVADPSNEFIVEQLDIQKISAPITA